MNKEATLGGTVRDRRLALGYSLGQLATKVNKTAASIRSWERGDTVPSGDETAALSDALDLDAELLITLREAALADAPMAVEPAEIAPADVDVDDPWEPGDATDEDAKPMDEEAASPSTGDQASSEVEDEDATVPDVDDAATEDEPGDAGDSDDAEVVAAADLEDDEEPPPEVAEDHSDIDSETEGGEALADAVAALAAAGFADDDEVAAEPVQPDPVKTPPQQPHAVASGGAVATDPAMHEAMTEAVPVIPAGAVAVSSPAAMPDMSRVAAEPYTAPRSSNPVVQAWDNVIDAYHRIFDPRRKWIYRVRWVLLLIAFFIMLRVLAWAGGELWEALGEVLDGIAFTPSETPDVSN